MTDEEMWVQPILFPIPEYEPIRWGEEIAAIEALCAENARLTAQLAIAREAAEAALAAIREEYAKLADAAIKDAALTRADMSPGDCAAVAYHAIMRAGEVR